MTGSSSSDRGAQAHRPGSGLSRRGVLKATGAGLAGAGLSSVVGTASAAGVTIARLARDGNQIVDPQGEPVTLRGVNIADPGEQRRDWRGMDAEAVFDMATAHPDWSNTVVRVPIRPEFVATGAGAASGPSPADLPHGDEWGPVLPGTFDAAALEDYLDAVVDPLVERAETNGSYVMLVYGRDAPVFHHREYEDYVTAGGGSPLSDPAYDDLAAIWDCETDAAVDHTVLSGQTEFEAFSTRDRHPAVCGERGLLWHGEDQIDEVLELADEQAVTERFQAVESLDDVYTEPAAICNALDREVETFWEVVASWYGDSDAVLFDVYDDPTGPYAGDWGSPDRLTGATLDPTPDETGADELWSANAKQYYDLWVERSEPWMNVAEDRGQGQVMTIGNPRWSQYVYWAPYNEYDNENVCYSAHVQLQEECRPLQDTVGCAAEHVPVFFSDFGWMNFDLYVPTPWLDGGIEWAIGETDPADEAFDDERGPSWSFERFLEHAAVHPICSTFDHTRRPNFFDHGTPGEEGDGARGSDHWYDDGFLIEEDTPGGWWQTFVNERSTEVNPGTGGYFVLPDPGPNALHETTDGYAFPTGEGPAPGPCSLTEDLAECESDGAVDAAELDDGQTVCDVDGDGSYRDVNADGDVSNGDVTDFFSNQHVDPWDSRADLFDFDGNDEVGQGDVVELFEYVN